MVEEAGCPILSHLKSTFTASFLKNETAGNGNGVSKLSLALVEGDRLIEARWVGVMCYS